MKGARTAAGALRKAYIKKITPKLPHIDMLNINVPSLNDWIGLKSIVIAAIAMAPTAADVAEYKYSTELEIDLSKLRNVTIEDA